jgi:hypothetical protein
MRLKDGELFAGIAYVALLAAALVTIVALSPGCGSNIPIDQDCEVLFESQDEEAETYECTRPGCDQEVASAFQDGYDLGFRDGSEGLECTCPEGSVCLTRAEFDEYSTGICEYCEERADCTDSYEEGYRDGQTTVVCTDDEEEEYVCDRDVPRGHLRKECRGKP